MSYLKDYFYVDLRRQCRKIIINTELDVGQGAKGLVHKIDDNTVVKLYRPQVLGNAALRRQLCQKALVMTYRFGALAEVKDFPLAWPLGPVFSKAPVGDKFDEDSFVGYVMPRVKNFYAIEEVYSDAKLGGRPINGTDRLAIAKQIAVIIGIVHDAGFVVGDINNRNLVVSTDTLKPTMIDCDSFQMRYRGRLFTTDVGTVDYSSPALLNRIQRNGGSFAKLERTPADDQFALAVLIFQILMSGAHPFDTQSGPIAVGGRRENILQHRFPYADGSNDKPPAYADVSRYARFNWQLRQQFEAVFVRGESVPPQAWISALAREDRSKLSQFIVPLPTAAPAAKPSPVQPSLVDRIKGFFRRLFS